MFTKRMLAEEEIIKDYIKECLGKVVPW